MMTVAIFAVLIGLMLLGVPIAVSMGLTAALFLVILGEPEHLIMVPARMYSSTTGFPLLAIPFFILAGNLMNTGGMTSRLFQFCQNLVGHIRGGLGHVDVAANMIVAGMSGSAIADAAGVGVVAMTAMRKAGFDRAFSAGVSAAAATIGPIIPPSIPLVIFGCMTGVSVGRLFLGGFVPGLLMGLGLMVSVYITSVKRGYPTQPRASFREILRSFRGAWSAILAPIIIVGGILTGVFTPTEASVAASFYAVVISIFIYREVNLKRLIEIVMDTVDQTVRVLFIISAAGLFGWLLIQQRVPETIIQFLLNLTKNPLVLLLIINGILIVLGCFMEAISAMLLTIPIFMPLVAKVGIDPVHFGVVMTLNLMIALLTPPVGMVLYTVSCVGEVPLWELASELKWHLLSLIVCLLLITYIPGLVTWLPNLVIGAAG